MTSEEPSIYGNLCAESVNASLRLDADIKSKTRKLNYRKNNLNNDSREIIELSDTKYPDLLKLCLSYNNLTELPKNFFSLKNLISLDLRKNNFKDINSIIDNISTSLKYITELKIDFNNSSQIQSLLSKIPNLLYINGKNTSNYISSIDVNKNILEEIDMQKKLSEFNDLFVLFQNNFQNASQGDLVNNITERFQKLINEEGNNISNNNKGCVSNCVIANNIIKSEFNLIMFFVNTFFDNSQYLNNEDDKKEISKKINENLSLLFNSLFNIIKDLNTKIQNFNKINNKKLEIFLDSLNDNNNNETNNNNSDDYNKLLKKYNEEKEYYSIKLESLQKENKYITDSLIKKGIDLANSTTSNKGLLNNNMNSLSSSNFTTTLRKEKDKVEISKFGDQTFLGISGAKILTKNVMHELINEIYDSKTEYDKLCNENHLKKESMERYMYKFLNNKYGLKNLVIEWSSSIIASIKMYSPKDSEINLFGKILKNKIDENTKFTVPKIKNTIKEIYTNYLKNKTKTSKEKIKEDFDENSPLSDEEWKSIIKVMYNEDEYNLIENYISNKITDLNEIEKQKYINNLLSKKKSEVTRDDFEQAENIKYSVSIKYKDLENILIEYQVIYREKYLSNLNKLFNQNDTDNCGTLNEKGFNNLMDSIEFIKNEGPQFEKKLLNKIDPHAYNNITFSDVVNLFSAEMIKDENGLSMSILDKLGLEDPGKFDSNNDNNTNSKS